MNSRRARSAATRASGSEPQVEHGVGGLGVQLAEREAGDLEEPLGLLEQSQALGESARLCEHEGFTLGEYGGQERADLLGQGTRPTGQRQGHAVPAQLGLDHREVVGHLGPDVDREVAPLQRLAVDRGGLRDPARILVHDRGLLLERRRRLVAEQPSSPQEVALGRRAWRPAPRSLPIGRRGPRPVARRVLLPRPAERPG